MRVCLALPCHGFMPVETCMGLMKLQSFDYQTNRFLRHIRSKGMSLVHWGRNALVRDFLALRDAEDRELTHLLFCDADMIPPPDGLLKLAEVDADIAAGLFTNRQIPIVPVMRRLVEGKLQQYPIEDIPQDEEALARAQPIEIDATGMAFTLIRREVFEKLSDPWFHFDPIPGQTEPPTEYGEDVTFCLRARAAGFKVVVRPDCIVGHVGSASFDIRHMWAASAQEASGDGSGNPG